MHQQLVLQSPEFTLDLVLKHLEREPLRYWKSDGNVTFTRPFLMLDKKVTFDEHIHVLEMYCKGDISCII